MIGATPSFASSYYANRTAPTGGATPAVLPTAPQPSTTIVTSSGQVMYNDAGKLWEALKNLWAFVQTKTGPMLANAFNSARAAVNAQGPSQP